MKNVLTSVITAACLVAAAAPAAAQAPGIDLKLNPRIGLYAPLTDLGEIRTTAGDVVAEQSGSLALGLGLELDMAALPVGVRLNLDYATATDVEVTGDGIGTTADPVETTMLAVVGDIIFRPLPRVVVAQPYLFAGGGLKQYDFEPTTDLGGAAETFQDESDFTLHLGGGLDVGLGPLAFNAEIGDYISWFELDTGAGDSESEMQHDLFVTVGFSIGLL